MAFAMPWKTFRQVHPKLREILGKFIRFDPQKTAAFT